MKILTATCQYLNLKKKSGRKLTASTVKDQNTQNVKKNASFIKTM